MLFANYQIRAVFKASYFGWRLLTLFYKSTQMVLIPVFENLKEAPKDYVTFIYIKKGYWPLVKVRVEQWTK